MERVVYVLGAGFSAPLGLPVVANFLAKSKDQYFRQPQRFQYFHEVFSAIRALSVIKNYCAADLHNIEEILSILEMDTHIEGASIKDEFIRYIKDVVEFYTPTYEINRSLATAPPPNWADLILGISPQREYGAFVSNLFHITIGRGVHPELPLLSEKFRISHAPSTETHYSYSVITLNYDRVLESYAEFLNKHFNCELAFGAAIDPENLRPPLAKLHGCVGSGVVVPPTWNKGGHDQIRAAWKLAHEVLMQANHIRFLGYSLPETDAYVRYLIKSSLVESEHLKTIDVLCRDNRGEARKRYDSFIQFPKYRFQSGGVGEYLGAVGGYGTRGDRVTFDGHALEQGHERFMDEAL